MKTTTFILLFAIVLSACAPAAVPLVMPPPAAESPAVELTLWHDYAVGGSEEAALTQILANYQKVNPNVTVKVEPVAFSGIFSEWDKQVAAGGGPDIFTAPNNKLGSQVRAGRLLDLTDRLKGKLGGVAPAAIGDLSINGRIYGVPGVVKAVALYYNKSTVPVPPATTEDLLALVRSGKKLVLNCDFDSEFGFFPAFGGVPWDDSGACVNTQVVADAFQFVADVKAAVDKGYCSCGTATTLFRLGLSDMIIEGPWLLGDLKKALGDKLGVAPMPVGPKGKAGPLVGIDGWFVNPNSKNADAAVALALYITNKEGQAIYADLAGDPPVRTDVVLSDPLVKVFADAGAAGYGRPQEPWLDNFWTPFDVNFWLMFSLTADPAQAAVDACTDMNKANNVNVTVPVPAAPPGAASQP